MAQNELGEMMPTLPKPDAQRRNKTKPTIPQEDLQQIAPVVIPEADPAWSDLAREWYDALGISAQSQLYDSSDWLEAKVAAGMLTKTFEGGKINASAYQAFVAASSRLLTCIGDRRRARVEVHRPDKSEAEAAKVERMNEYRLAATG